MKRIVGDTGLEFQDVLIRPVPSKVVSRDNVDISVKLTDTFTLNFPLVASPMVGVTNGEFLSKLSDLGGLGFVHRFYDSDEELESELNLLIDKNFGIAVRLNQDFEWLLQYNPKIILIDVANGYTKSVLDYCLTIKKYAITHSSNTLVMAGNVVTGEGAMNLLRSGCDLVRFGIGSGSNCSTRNVTGVSVPTISALLNMPDVFLGRLVVDGGIRSSGDLVKSIVAGAAFGMSGRLFAETYEAPNNGKLYGMASRTHQTNMGYQIKSVEGFDTYLTKVHSLETFVREFSYGIKSAGTYLNSNNLLDMYNNGEFVLAGSNSISWRGVI